MSVYWHSRSYRYKETIAGEIISNSTLNQLYYLRAEDKPFLNDWMKQKCDKCTSKVIQNEIMKVMVLQVLRDIAAEICSADFSLSWSTRPPTLQIFHS